MFDDRVRDAQRRELRRRARQRGDNPWARLVWGCAILAAGMSNLSAALNALASTTIMDFYKPLAGATDEKRLMFLARIATVVNGKPTASA